MKCTTTSTERMRNLLLAAGLMTAIPVLHAESAGDVAESPSPEKERLESMIESTHVVVAGGGEAEPDSVRRLLNIFYQDQFRHFQDPRAPYFMFMSKDGSLALGVGGVIKASGYFDWNGSIPGSDFSPYSIPIPKDPTAKRNLAATASGSGLFFTLLGHNTLLGDFKGYIQAGFSGYNNRDFKLKKAYLTIGDWTAGLATTTFEDCDAEPPTVDGAGANGINSKTNVLVRYMHTFKDEHWTVAGSFEFPGSDIDADGEYTKACNDYIPDIAAFAQYQWAGGDSHVRLSGLTRVLTYRDLLKARNHNIMGWAVQLSGVIKVIPQLTLYGIASVGQGHESYTTDLGNDSFDLVPDEHAKGRLYAPTAVGYVFGATYYFTPKLFSNIVLSEQRYYPKNNPGDGQYKYGLYGAANIFWDITPRLEVGLEYLAGKRMDFNRMHGNANRLMAMMQLSF